jgi:hypothetical protein
MSISDFPSTPTTQVTQFLYHIHSSTADQTIAYVVPGGGDADGLTPEDRLTAFEDFVRAVATEMSALSVTKHYVGIAEVIDSFS